MLGQIRLAEGENCFDVSKSCLFSTGLIMWSSQYTEGGHIFEFGFSLLCLNSTALSFTLESLSKFNFT